VKKLIVLILTLSLVIILSSNNFAQKKYLIKFATIAPEGSTWMNIMNELNDEIKQKTDNNLRFRIYHSGQQGDELNVVRKMRFGQIHSAGLTGKGMGDILPESRVLELPFLFDNAEEYDYVEETLFDYFYDLFEEKGFILLGGAEVGFVYVFSNIPIRSPEDMRNARMWMWEGDPLVRETYKTFGVTPIPLPITDVLTSLQTNLIDAFYISPLAAIALQWFTKVKYMTEIPLTNASGVVLMRKKFYDELPEEFQICLKECTKRHLRRLVIESRDENRRAIDVLKENGISIVSVEDQEKINYFRNLGLEVQNNLVGKLYSQKTLDLVLSTLKEYRDQKANQQ